MPEQRPGLGNTLGGRLGPLPVWAWAGLFVIVVAAYLAYRRNKNAQQQAAQQAGMSTNLGTTPVSNLTTQGQPMPIQMGDTFINVPGSVPSTSTTSTPTTTVVSNPQGTPLEGVQPNAGSLSGTGPTDTQPTMTQPQTQ